MCWQCDNPRATIDDYLDHLRMIIKFSGWAVQYVEDKKKPFAYTVGLHEKGLPELLLTGLPPQESARLLNSIAQEVIAEGVVLQPPLHIDFQSELYLEVVEVDHPFAHLKMAVNIYGPVRAVQLVWTDDHSRWPWDRGWARRRRPQAVVGQRHPLAG